MGERHSWMKWGSEGITPDDIDSVADSIPKHATLKKWKQDWESLNEKLENDEIAPELFSKAVTKAMFPLYYLAEASTNLTSGLYTIKSATAKKSNLMMTTFEVIKKSLDEISSYFDKTTYKGFKSAIAGSGGRGVLSDGPKEKLKNSVPKLDHVRLGAGRSSDRLWYSDSGNVIYAVSGHIDTTKNGGREHDKLVKKVNGLGSTKCTLAYCDLDGFEGELFYVQ